MAKGRRRGKTCANPCSTMEQALIFYTSDSATVAGATRKKGAPTRCLTRLGPSKSLELGAAARAAPMHPKGPAVTDRYFQDSLFLPHDEKGYLGPVGKDIELDAVGRQFETYPYRLLRLHR